MKKNKKQFDIITHMKNFEKKVDAKLKQSNHYEIR